MSKIAALLIRKSTIQSKPGELLPEDSAVDLDEELFSSIGAELGSNNETLRNLLLNANAKIGELDGIKEAVARLVGPVSKALREFETEKAEKINLQAALSTTRTAYGKLRNEVTELEKKSLGLEREAEQLRKDLSFAENAARALETVRGELAVDIAARRAQIADLEGRLNQELAETKSLRDENARLNDRLSGADKRIVQLEAEINNLRQKLVLVEDEKRALQGSFEKTAADASRSARRLAETESNLAAVQGRLRNVEGNLAEIVSERGRLSAALDEATEKHAGEITKHQMRFEALQARAGASDRLLSEAREQLAARGEEVRALERRLSETTLERDTLATRAAALEADVFQRDSALRDGEVARNALVERAGALAKAYNNKEAEVARSDETIKSLTEQVAFLEQELRNTKQNVEKQLEELNEALRREKVERAVVEGALEAARKDFGRLMREVMTLEQQKIAREPVPALRSANAA
jgi:chromosome segregation ATPase